MDIETSKFSVRTSDGVVIPMSTAKGHTLYSNVHYAKYAVQVYLRLVAVA